MNSLTYGPNDAECGVYQGDCRALIQGVPDESIDLIFTDPPYLKEYLPMYGWLAQEAARVLKPGGFCLAMCGGLYFDQIVMQMSAYLTFFWKYEIELTGQAAGVVWVNGNNKVPIATRSKPILAYSKGESLPRTFTFGMFRGTGNDKRYHCWGQDEASTRYFVDCFSAPGELVLDPFCGGGTTPAMCKVLGRRWLAFEIDTDVAESARERIRHTQMPLFVEHEQLPLEGVA